ncbi:MAG: hypothetical protein ACT4PI_06670 [Actinomycetota bacterium]
MTETTLTNPATAPAVRPRTRGPIACAIATAGVLIGLAIDILIHWLAVDHDDGGVFDPGNPGHLVAGISLAVLVGAVVLTLADARGAIGRRALAVAVAATFATGALGVGMGAAEARLMSGHVEGDAHPTSDWDPMQIEELRAATERYQDIEVAEADGFYQASEDDARMGAHFGKDEWGYLDEFEPSRPSTLLYTQRLSGKWELVGLGYSVSLDAYPEAPIDLAGAHWHRHRWTCWWADDGFGTTDGPMTEDECVAQGGEWFDEFGWELHVWTFLENPLGPFEDLNPLLP